MVLHKQSQGLSARVDSNSKVVNEKVHHLSLPSFKALEDDLSLLIKAMKQFITYIIVVLII
jgi:hypothetical protein